MAKRRSASPTDHFSTVAESYAAHRPSYPVALVDFLADVAPRRGLAWDAGCGSGQLSVPLAASFGRVIATDASAEQVARATPHPAVHYYCARAEATGLPGGVADLIVAAQAAHWFDPAGYYAEARRVARADSIIALITYGRAAVDDAVDPTIHRFRSETLAPHWPSERRQVEDGYRSLPFPFTEIAVPRLEMRMEWTLPDLLGYVETWSAVRALERAEGRAPIERFRRDLTRAWGAWRTVRPVRWPLSLRVGRLTGHG